MDFAAKVRAVQKAQRRGVVLLMAPQVSRLPLSIQRYDDPFLPFGKAVIQATNDLVCGYMFDLAAYLTLGAAGIIALERTIPLVNPETLRILHGPFVGPSYALAAFEGNFDLDAVTLADAGDAAAYLARPHQGVFVVRPGQPDRHFSFAAFWPDAGVFTLPTTDEDIQLKLAGADVLFASRSEDFTQQVRAAIERINDG